MMRLLKLSHVPVVLQLVWVRTSPQLSWITSSRLVYFIGCQGSYGIVAKGPAESAVTFNIRQGLKY